MSLVVPLALAAVLARFTTVKFFYPGIADRKTEFDPERSLCADLVLDSDSDPEHSLAQLESEQPTVSDAQRGTCCFGQIVG